MPQSDELKRRLIEIAAALATSEHALLAMASIDEGEPASPEDDAVEIAENFLAIADPYARRMLLRLSRRLVGRKPSPVDISRS